MARTANTYAQVVAAEGAKKLQQGQSYFVPVTPTAPSLQKPMKTASWRKLPRRGTSGSRVPPLRSIISPAESHQLATSMFVTPEAYDQLEKDAAAGLLALRKSTPPRRSARLANKRRK